jgi:hypothetical protein
MMVKYGWESERYALMGRVLGSRPGLWGFWGFVRVSPAFEISKSPTLLVHLVLFWPLAFALESKHNYLEGLEAEPHRSFWFLREREGKRE